MKAEKALLNLKHLRSDDIGHLRRIKAKELSTEVKCHNHAQTVALKRQLDHWFKEQNVSINKLNREQQKAFRKLIQVQNEKRKIQRRAHIQKQRQIQEILREQAARDREQAKKKSLQLSLALKKIKFHRRKNKNNAVEADILDTDASDTSTDIATSVKLADPLSKINVTEKLQPISEKSKGNKEQEHLESEENVGEKWSYSGRLSPDSEIINTVSYANAVNLPDLLEKEKLKKKWSLPTAKSIDPANLNETGLTDVKELKKAVLPNITNDTHSNGNLHFSLSSSQSTHKEMDTLSVLPPIPSDQIPVFHDSVTETNSSIISSSVSSFSKTNSKPNLRKSYDEDKYHIGIPNRKFKLPDYDIPVVNTVTRYRKSGDGSYVSSEIKVRQAVEYFRLPSKRDHYWSRRALQMEREKESARKQKVDEFVGKQKNFDTNHQKMPKEQEATKELFQQQYPKAGIEYLTLNSNIYRQAMLGVLRDEKDPRNCRYLRNVPNKDEDDDHEKAKDGTPRTSPSRRVKNSTWGKFSSKKEVPRKKDDYYYVSLI